MWEYRREEVCGEKKYNILISVISWPVPFHNAVLVKLQLIDWNVLVIKVDKVFLLRVNFFSFTAVII